MYCAECGKRNKDGAVYCENCGHLLKKSRYRSARKREKENAAAGREERRRKWEEEDELDVLLKDIEKLEDYKEVEDTKLNQEKEDQPETYFDELVQMAENYVGTEADDQPEKERKLKKETEYKKESQYEKENQYLKENQFNRKEQSQEAEQSEKKDKTELNRNIGKFSFSPKGLGRSFEEPDTKTIDFTEHIEDNAEEQDEYYSDEIENITGEKSESEGDLADADTFGSDKNEGAEESEGMELADEETGETAGESLAEKKEKFKSSIVFEKDDKPKVNIFKRYGIILAEFLLCIALGVAFFMVGSNSDKPEKIAEEFFKAMAEQNWEKAYDLMQLPASEFLTKEFFLRTMADEAAMSYAQINVQRLDDEEQESKKAAIRIEYSTEGSEQADIYDIELVKKDKKKMFFFDQWEVDGSAVLAENVSLLISKGVQAQLDMITLTGDYREEGDDYYDNYVIPYLFIGNHLLEMIDENEESYQELVYIPKMDNYQYYSEDLELPDETKQLLFDQACTALQKIYKAGVDRKEYEDIESLFTDNEEVKAMIQEKYTEFSDKLCDENGNGVKSIIFENIEGTIEQQGNEDSMKVGVTLDCNFSLTIENAGEGENEDAEEDEDGENDENDEEVIEDKREGVYSTQFTFMKENGQWIILDYTFNIAE